MTLKVGEIFAGIGGFGLGAQRAGMEVAWQIEIDPFCRKVLKKRFPGVTRYGDVTKVNPERLEKVDGILFGWPCQDHSVAGKRAGLKGQRSGLFHEAARIIRALKPNFILAENVPGVLSSNSSKDFTEVLRELADRGRYGFRSLGYNVLDSSRFGVPQRRRRVFLVGSTRPGCAEKVLFEPESSQRDPPPGRKAGGRVARTITAGVARSRGVNPPGRRREDDDNIVFGAVAPDGTDGATLTASNGAKGINDQTPLILTGDHKASTPDLPQVGTGQSGSGRTYVSEPYHIQDANGGNKRQGGLGVRQGGPSYTLDRYSNHAVGLPIAFDRVQDAYATTDMSPAIMSNGEPPGVALNGSCLKIHCGCGHDFFAASLEAPCPGCGRIRDGQVTYLTPMTLRDREGGNTRDGRTGGKGPLVSHDLSLGLKASNDQVLGVPEWRGQGGDDLAHALAPTLSTKNEPASSGAVRDEWYRMTAQGIGAIRRLTPTETERLQGFPDSWTCLCGVEPYTQATCRCKDTPRYRGCGNAVTVNVVHWLLDRIRRFEEGGLAWP